MESPQGLSEKFAHASSLGSSDFPLSHQTFPWGCTPRESLMTLGNSLEQIFPDNPYGLSTVCTRYSLWHTNTLTDTVKDTPKYVRYSQGPIFSYRKTRLKLSFQEQQQNIWCFSSFILNASKNDFGVYCASLSSYRFRTLHLSYQIQNFEHLIFVYTIGGTFLIFWALTLTFRTKKLNLFWNQGDVMCRATWKHGQLNSTNLRTTLVQCAKHGPSR